MGHYDEYRDKQVGNERAVQEGYREAQLHASTLGGAGMAQNQAKRATVLDNLMSTAGHVQAAHDLLDSIMDRIDGPAAPAVAGGLHSGMGGGPGLLDVAEALRARAEHLLPRLNRLLNSL